MKKKEACPLCFLVVCPTGYSSDMHVKIFFNLDFLKPVVKNVNLFERYKGLSEINSRQICYL